MWSNCKICCAVNKSNVYFYCTLLLLSRYFPKHMRAHTFSIFDLPITIRLLRLLHYLFWCFPKFLFIVKIVIYRRKGIQQFCFSFYAGDYRCFYYNYCCRCYYLLHYMLTFFVHAFKVDSTWTCSLVTCTAYEYSFLIITFDLDFSFYVN